MNQNDTKKKVSKKIGITILCVTTGMIIGTMGCIIFKQQIDINKNKSDIKLLKEVLHANVIHSLRETYKRKLRYHEGRLMNGLATSGMTNKDISLRKEEIEFLSNQLEKLDAAETLINH